MKNFRNRKYLKKTSSMVLENRDAVDNMLLIQKTDVIQHIAIATVERVDALVSWNFKQIVNLDRIRKFNAVNLMQGYPVLEIRSPLEVLYGKEN